MADLDNVKVSKDFHVDTPFDIGGDFHVKGAGHLDWGMKKRLSNIFDKDSGNTVMFAFDHGYFMGPTSGLERLDIIIPKVIDHVDVLMGTRGAFRTSVDPATDKGIALRSTSGSSMLNDDLSHEVNAVSMEDGIRLNADILAVQTFIGADGQLSSLENLSETVNLGMKYGIPTMGVVAVGKEMERTPEFFKLATRILAELGANVIKTYYCEDFKEVVAASPVPLVVAGGKKVSEKDALELAYNAIRDGAKGVDMGRNIFQSKYPTEMAMSIKKVVHEKYTGEEAYEYYLGLVDK